LGWVAMAAPGRVVLWPTVAGLPCRRLWRGWDHTSIPRSGVGCLPRWEGSSCGWWPRRRRGIEAGQHGSGSRLDEVLTPTTRVAAPDRGQDHHQLERHSPTSTTPFHGSGACRVEWCGTRPARHQATDLLGSTSRIGEWSGPGTVVGVYGFAGSTCLDDKRQVPLDRDFVLA
jgi:hypothetical protein